MFDFRKLATNFSFLVFGEVISKIFTFAAFAFLARTFGPEKFGHLEFVLALMIFATLLTDFGANPLGSREVAKASVGIGRIVTSIIVMRMILAIVTYCLLAGFIQLFFRDESHLKNLMLLYGFSLFFIPFFLQFVFQGLEKMKWVATCSVIRQVVFALGVFIVVSNVKDLWVVACVEIAAVFSVAVYCVYMLVFNVQASGFKTDTGRLLITFREALPIGLSDITWAFMWYFVIILLGFMTAGKEVGWFSAAHRPVMTMHTFVWLYFCNLLPTISRSVNEPKEMLNNLMRYSMSLMSWGTVFFGAFVLTMAEPLMILVFGGKFHESARVIKILIWMIPLSSLGCHYRYILIGYGNQKYEFFSQALAAVVSVIMGLILIPIYAERGAAVSLISSLSVYCVLVYIFVKISVRRIPFLPYVSKPILVGACQVALFYAINTYKLWVAVCVSVIFYFMVMMILQPETRKILAMVLSRKGETTLGNLESS
jgi:O-antigen/teichoic acid export membrane protein